MVSGFATAAGGVLAAYRSIGLPTEHWLAAAVLSIQAGGLGVWLPSASKILPD